MNIRENILHLAPYVPGKPIEELGRELGLSEIIKLASNENPLGPSPKALAAARAALDRVHRYPDGSGHHLRHALAARHGVSEAQIVLGNGSNDVLEIVARTVLAPGDEVVFSQFAFIVYRLVSQAIGARIVEVPATAELAYDLDALAAAVSEKTRLIFLANPNNPTGTMLGQEGWERFLARIPEDVLVVVDEAYAEYVDDPDYADPWKDLAAGRNLVITRTFSKIFGLAGLRLGYGVTTSEIAALLHRVRQPFNANLVAQDAALAALADETFLRHSRESNARGIRYLARHLEDRGFAVTPSWGNFVLADFGRDCMPLYEALLRQGVIVRPMAGYGLPHSIRVSVGTPEELQILNKALDTVLGELRR